MGTGAQHARAWRNDIRGGTNLQQLNRCHHSSHSPSTHLRNASHSFRPHSDREKIVDNFNRQGAVSPRRRFEAKRRLKNQKWKRTRPRNTCSRGRSG
jgi:hypothetical protein